MPTQYRRAEPAANLNPCMHCPWTRDRFGRKPAPTSYTIFVRWHPFKPGWEIRRCVTCGKHTAQDSRS